MKMDKVKISFLWLVIVIAVCCSAISAQSVSGNQRLYTIKSFDSLGGTNSRGNSINNRGWIAGFSNLSPTVRHAALWRGDTVTDLGTLGAFERNSAVTWSVKNNNGLIVGISQTDTPMPLGENWSCSAFIAGTSYTCLGFVWENGVMRPLNPLPGGNNSFATGANNRGEIVGWAENGVRDPTCVANNQVLQFRPTAWDARTLTIRELPTLPGDSSGALTAINNKGQIVGISGDCDQAIGRRTARHAVLWDRNRIIDLGNLGADFWNTPTSINDRGDIVGFAGTPDDPEGNIFQAFIWTKRDGIKLLRPLQNLNHVHAEAWGINERRQVVGISCDAAFLDCRAIIWEKGVAKDLNALKANNFVPRLDQARDINERGEITGRSIDAAGVRRTFLAIPTRNNDDDDAN
jgi:probable HAF family extracellular repeat protein